MNNKEIGTGGNTAGLVQGVKIRVVLADDHRVVREGVKALLSCMSDVTVVGEAANSQDLLTLVDELLPDQVLMVISMPGMDGLKATELIRARHPEVCVLLLPAYDGTEFVRRAIASGACGYLVKDNSPFELEDAVHAVARTGSYYSPAVLQALRERPEPTVHDQLTGRQVEILEMLAEGHSAKEIAYELGLSSKTVDIHRQRIMERLGLNDVASLTRYAIRQKLIEP